MLVHAAAILAAALLIVVHVTNPGQREYSIRANVPVAVKPKAFEEKEILPDLPEPAWPVEKPRSVIGGMPVPVKYVPAARIQPDRKPWDLARYRPALSREMETLPNAARFTRTTRLVPRRFSKMHVKVSADDTPASVHETRRRVYGLVNARLVLQKRKETRSRQKRNAERALREAADKGNFKHAWVRMHFAAPRLYNAVLRAGGAFSVAIPGRADTYAVIRGLSPLRFGMEKFNANTWGEIVEGGPKRPYLAAYLRGALEEIASETGVAIGDLAAQKPRILWTSALVKHQAALIAEELVKRDRVCDAGMIRSVDLRAVWTPHGCGFEVEEIEFAEKGEHAGDSATCGRTRRDNMEGIETGEPLSR
jgi:hypothetical protein